MNAQPCDLQVRASDAADITLQLCRLTLFLNGCALAISSVSCQTSDAVNANQLFKAALARYLLLAFG
jgi:glycine cleavage system regulatory protein